MSTEYYEKKYPKTLEYMRKFAGRKFDSISRHNKNEIGKLLISEDPDTLTEAPSTAEAYFNLGGQISKYLDPANYFSVLSHLMENNDSAVAREKLADYTIKAMRHAVDKAVEDLWSDCIGDPELNVESLRNNYAYDAVACSQRAEAKEWKKAA